MGPRVFVNSDGIATVNIDWDKELFDSLQEGEERDGWRREGNALVHVPPWERSGLPEYMDLLTDPNGAHCLNCAKPLLLGEPWVRLWPADHSYSTAHHLRCFSRMIRRSG